ncbi:MAG: hypothetical protein IAC51_01285 [bacterium]|uniref:Uncharacterized protein n=1 Tax=Candidatus Aphodosoma intestinipullorum TaxID=2840674 RepID=A0A940DI22_9BACT|nr:hypothetical protein [Candidatus Aphodosoma intestinipullorum]
MPYSSAIQEEELKNKVAHDYFSDYDTTEIKGKIDFCIAIPQDGQELFEREYLLWAEAKAGTKKDIYESFVQLILTIGRARTIDTHLPPAFLGAFDAEKIAFLPYSDVIDIFQQSDFNWNVTPSNHATKEFTQLYSMVKETIERSMLSYRFGSDDKELRDFIKKNFVTGKSDLSKIRINRNNYIHIYQKWVQQVKPTIAVDWEIAKKEGLLDLDFYLADILSEHNISLKEKLYVLLRSARYMYNIQRKATGAMSFEMVDFNDKQVAHTQFWNRYQRPPRREYWDEIVMHRERLVPQDVRERKGSYFTPQKWVELSQQYLADELGEEWQDEYYVWDCAAGTGNLLNGLTNKYNIWASTLDQADVDVMLDRIHNGANLLESHVFQFDFLNDPFTKLPQPLQEIINDPEKRKKLVIYINPPYAEAANKRTVTGNGENKTNVAVKHLTYTKYLQEIGIAGRELFAQFFIRIYHEIPTCVLAEFSKLKILQAPNFRDFRNVFRAKLGRNFAVPSYTFDNVKGKFPIFFGIWHLNTPEIFKETYTNFHNEDEVLFERKHITTDTDTKSINDWIITTRNREQEKNIGYMSAKGSDFQNTNYNFIINSKSQLPHPRGTWITDKNIGEIAVYYAVRQCIEPTWYNDRNQFLYPNDGWKTDNEFQTDCLAYALFTNNIQSQYGLNHWIPFTEREVDAKEKFASHFMTDYISGKSRRNKTENHDLFNQREETKRQEGKPLHFSAEAQAVMDAGRELWRYYHTQPGANPNASLYDIRLHFQGRNEKGKMNPDSNDTRYTELITALRQSLKTLAKKIEPMVYKYGFLKK